MSSQQWRAPAAARVKTAVGAAFGITVAAVFFPLWFAVPAAAACGAWGLGMAVLGSRVVLDAGAGVLVMRAGLITRRVRITDVRAVLVERAKVSVARARGGEISLYAWRRDRLDDLLGIPVVAGDIGHAIASAVALAQPAGRGPAAQDRPATTTGGRPDGPGRARSRLATALLGGAGVLAIVGALVVRVRWDNPALTVLGVIIALTLGVLGLFYLLVALWILLTGRAPRITVPQ